MYRVGITGGIASGKSTVCSYFSELGINIIDADIIAKQLTAIGSHCYLAIVSEFGSNCLNSDDSLNRTYLRERIFSDAKAKQTLEDIMHPVIHATMLEQSEQATPPYCLLAIPLLAESQHDYLLDRVLVVRCPETQQIARLMQRDQVSEATAYAILSQQASDADRLAIADDVINNNNSLGLLQKQVADLDSQYQQFALAKE